MLYYSLCKGNGGDVESTLHLYRVDSILILYGFYIYTSDLECRATGVLMREAKKKKNHDDKIYNRMRRVHFTTDKAHGAFFLKIPTFFTGTYGTSESSPPYCIFLF